MCTSFRGILNSYVLILNLADLSAIWFIFYARFSITRWNVKIYVFATNKSLYLSNLIFVQLVNVKNTFYQTKHLFVSFIHERVTVFGGHACETTICMNYEFYIISGWITHKFSGVDKGGGARGAQPLQWAEGPPLWKDEIRGEIKGGGGRWLCEILKSKIFFCKISPAKCRKSHLRYSRFQNFPGEHASESP